MRNGFKHSAVGLASAAIAAAALTPRSQQAANPQTPPTMAIGNENGSVMVVFDRHVDYIGLDPESAVQTARMLCEQAKAAGLEGTAFVMRGNGANFAAQLADIEPLKTFEQVAGKSEPFGWVQRDEGYVVLQHSEDKPIAIFSAEQDAEDYCAYRNQKSD